MPSTGRSRDTLFLLADPVLLCAVAAVQLYLVEQRSLSRYMPSKRRLAELTETLRRGAWVHLTVVSASQHYQDLLRAAGQEYRDSTDDLQFQTQAGPARIDFGEMKLVRMLDKDEGPSDDEPLVVTGARVEVWRYFFDREALVLRARKIAEHASRGDGS